MMYQSALKMTKTGLSVLAVGLLITGGATATSASLIAYEPFDYPPSPAGTDTNNHLPGITGLDGGIGFDGAWTDNVQATSTFGSANRATGIAGPDDFPSHDRQTPLSYTDANGNVLPTQGNQARTSFGGISIASRDLDGTYGNPGDTIWLSFLGQSANATTGTRWAGFSLGDSDGLYFGRSRNSQGNWGVAHLGNPLIESTTPLNQQVFYVAKLEYNIDPNEDSKITLWINPLLDTEPLENDGWVGYAKLSSFDFILMAGNFSTDLDEFRLATSYFSVIPEPASLVLMGIGALLMLKRRRHGQRSERKTMD